MQPHRDQVLAGVGLGVLVERAGHRADGTTRSGHHGGRMISPAILRPNRPQSAPFRLDSVPITLRQQPELARIQAQMRGPRQVEGIDPPPRTRWLVRAALGVASGRTTTFPFQFSCD